MLLLRILLLPFALLYGAAIAVRNFLYRSGILNRTQFDIPIICVGNLSAGGTGKTPHIEWLIRKLSPQYRLAVLSRGYMRRTKGYVFANLHADARSIGDEPYQLHRKFPEVAVGVSENRVLGVPDLLADAPETEVILMDDGFQHLPVRAGFNILLTPYHQRFTQDWLLPAGRLREFRSGAQRADVIIVTKCPSTGLSSAEQEQVKKEIGPLPHQSVFFSYNQLSNVLKPVFPQSPYLETEVQYDDQDVLCVSGIAHAASFETDLQRAYTRIHPLRYGDHHHYSEHDLRDIVARFTAINAGKKCIITTEKDAVKWKDHPQRELLAGLPVYYLETEVFIMSGGEEALLNQVRKYVAETN